MFAEEENKNKLNILKEIKDLNVIFNDSDWFYICYFNPWVFNVQVLFNHNFYFQHIFFRYRLLKIISCYLFLISKM